MKTPTTIQIAKAHKAFLQGAVPGRSLWYDWFVKFDDGTLIPVKHLYGLALGISPRPWTTNQIKRVLLPLELDIVFRPKGNKQPVTPLDAELKRAEREAIDSGAFDPDKVGDTREKILGAIVRRYGQKAFRNALLQAYGGKCAITNCDVTRLLEAAHVYPYMGSVTNTVKNGLLLRTDFHTLFDLQLIAIDHVSGTILVSPELAGSEYAKWSGRKLRKPLLPSARVDVKLLELHRAKCGW